MTIKTPPDYIYDPNAWECTYIWGDRDIPADGLADDGNCQEPYEFGTLIEGPRVYAVEVVLTRDDAGDPDKTEIRWFDDYDTAKRAAEDRLPRIILLNGPPHSGKDTIGKLLAKHLSPRAVVEKFAQPIRDAACATFPWITEDHLDSLKDKPLWPNGEPTLRQWMMAFSENFMKPQLGNATFARLLIRRIVNTPAQFVVVTDSGFFEEALAMQRAYSPDCILLCQIEREGYTFAGDSRGYIRLGPSDLKVRNEEDSADAAVNKILDALKERGWWKAKKTR